MSSRAGWSCNGKHFCETDTERGGRRYFIDGKPTPKVKFFTELAEAKAAGQLTVGEHGTARVAGRDAVGGR